MTKEMVGQVFIKDSTVREGNQMNKVSHTVYQMIEIVEYLVKFGVPYIEGPWLVPISEVKSKEDKEVRQRAEGFYMEAVKLDLGRSKLFAFGSTKEKGVKPKESRFLKALLATKARNFTVFGKSWTEHVFHVLETTLEENLRMIADSVKFLKENGELVFFDAEHFFDGFKADPKYALKTIREAAQGGADAIILCDTNGGVLPHEIIEIFLAVKKEVSMPLGVHLHNDSGSAIASSLLAVREGASIVEVTVNGYSERCGMPDLCAILSNLILKMNYDCVGITKENLKNLKKFSYFVSEKSNLLHDSHQPFVGDSAFCHKAGTHQPALEKYPWLQEHINPEDVGNERSLAISDMAGSAGITYYLKEKFKLEIDRANPLVDSIKDEIRALNEKGFHIETAPESLEILVRRHFADYIPPFKVTGFKADTSSKNIEGKWKHSSEANVKVEIGNELEHVVFDSKSGQVSALDRALRKALGQYYSELKETYLIDFTVHVLNPNGSRGTASWVRVAIESLDKINNRRYVTAGISENLVVAAFQALIDFYELKIFNSRLIKN
jgi:2-isopropylmalate synthase